MCFGCFYYIRRLDIVNRFFEKSFFVSFFVFSLDYVAYYISLLFFVKAFFFEFLKNLFQRRPAEAGRHSKQSH